jgi:hypothetical protein
MIRINLLPITDSDRIEDGQKFFGMLFMGVVMVAVFFYMYHTQMKEELATVDQVLGSLDKKKKELLDKNTEHANLEAEFKTRKANGDRQKEIIDNLTQNQVSPAGMLFELSSLLSPPKDDNERQNVIQRGWKSNWNTGEAWLEKLTENKLGENQRSLTLILYVRNMDDESELMERLEDSKYFLKPVHKFSEQQKLTFDNTQIGSFLKFQIETRTFYGPGDLKKYFQEEKETIPTEQK